MDGFEKAFKKLQGQLARKSASSLPEDLRKELDDLIEQQRDGGPALPGTSPLPGLPGGSGAPPRFPGQGGREAPAVLRAEPSRTRRWAAAHRASPADPAPNCAEGVVQEVSPKGFVRISIGSDDGIQRGHTLEVYRLAPPTYLGRLLIVDVTPHNSVGKACGAPSRERRSSPTTG